MATEHTIKGAATIANFVKGGNAIFTLVNTESGGRFTYRVQKVEDSDRFFVGVLSGPDNLRSYRYLGMVTSAGEFVRTKGSKVAPSAPSFRAFAWAWGRLQRASLPSKVEVRHAGRCGRCGRLLTVPESIETGLGPVCAARD